MDFPREKLRRDLEKCFGSAPGRVYLVRAPGRVNLIGEHVDYNDGYVFPMAIEPEIRFACRARDDGRIRLASDAFADRIVEFSVNQRIERLDRKSAEAWTNYPRGMIAELIAAGVPVSGMDCVLSNTVPVGGGLSSSAALLIGTGVCALAPGGQEMDRQRLALLAQKAEHEFAGAPVGIMDQTIVASARAGTAMLLDCRDLTRRFVPLDANELRVVIVNSMVRHELSGGEYAQRRKQCEEGAKILGVQSLRDATMPMLEAAKGKLSDVVFCRSRHVITEIARTTQFAELLERKHYDDAGMLMIQSHESLRDDYQVSVAELDFLQEQAMTIKGVYGSRMTGGGFGGCIIALAQPRAADPLINHLTKVYPDKFGKNAEIFVTTATAAAGLVE